MPPVFLQSFQLNFQLSAFLRVYSILQKPAKSLILCGFR